MRGTKTKRGLQWLASLGLLALLNGCGGGGGGTDPTYTVSFTVTGELPSALTVRNGCCDDVAVTAPGTYTFPTALPSGAHYDMKWVQPSAAAQTCNSTHGAGIVGSANVSDLLLECVGPPLLSISGTVVGLTGNSVTLEFTGSQGPAGAFVALSTVGNGAFPGFTLPNGNPYGVRVYLQPTGPAQTCTVTNGVGVLAGANVNNVRVVCAPPVVPSSCTPPSGAGTTHGSVGSAAETWSAAGSPHFVPFDLSIGNTITLEACAVVRIAPRVTITIRPPGALIAAGAAGMPVTIERQVAGSAWASIRNLGATLSLSHAVLRGGGDPLSSGAAFAGMLQMQSVGTSGVLHVDDVEITGSQTQGVYINGDVGFDASSQNLRVFGAAGYPLHVYARVVGSVPSGSYAGNGRDAIAIAGSGGPVVSAQTLRDRGVPYHVGSGGDGGRMDISTQVGGPAAVLTIEPGVTMQFAPGGSLNVNTAGHGGALVAKGGPGAQQIVLTSDRGAAAAAGDWLGIVFNDAVDAPNAMTNTRVEFAGGQTASNDASCPYPGRVGVNYAAIRIFGAPSSEFITNSTVIASLRDGIDRGWRADLQPDFLASNTFTGIGGCKQSTPRTAAGVCPAVPACP